MNRRKMRCLAPAQTGYLMIPTELLACSSPIAVGVYALLAWLWHRYPAGLSISAQSIAQYGGIRPGTARSTLTALAKRGWITMEAHGTRTSQITPSWGPGQRGQPRPWDREKQCYGRPKKTSFRTVDARLLSWALGTITLIPQKGVDIERSWTHHDSPVPLLTLAQIGIYIRALHGQAAPDATPLMQLGLLDAAGHAHSFPPTWEQFLATVTLASIQFHGLPTPVPAAFDRITSSQPQQLEFDDLAFFCMQQYMQQSMSICMLVSDPAEEPESRSHSLKSLDATCDGTSPWLRSVDHDINLTNPPSYPTAEHPMRLEETIVDLYHVVNPQRAIDESEWEDLRLLRETHDSQSITDILTRALNRRRGGPPVQIFPEYIMSSLQREAEQKITPPRRTAPRQRPVPDPALYAALDGIHARDKIIRAGWATEKIVTTWRERMQLMHPLGYDIRSPNAWLARQLLSQTPPPTEDEVRERFARARADDPWADPTAMVAQFAEAFPAHVEANGRESLHQPPPKEHTPWHDAPSSPADSWIDPATPPRGDSCPASIDTVDDPWHEPQQRPLTAEEATRHLQARLRQCGGILMQRARALTLPTWTPYPAAHTVIAVVVSSQAALADLRPYECTLRSILADMADLDPQHCLMVLRAAAGYRDM